MPGRVCRWSSTGGNKRRDVGEKCRIGKVRVHHELRKPGRLRWCGDGPRINRTKDGRYATIRYYAICQRPRLSPSHHRDECHANRRQPYFVKKSHWLNTVGVRHGSPEGPAAHVRTRTLLTHKSSVVNAGGCARQLISVELPLQ